jgi:hypothetical protein
MLAGANPGPPGDGSGLWGGIFFQFDNLEQLYRWYGKHLGITRARVPGGYTNG